MSDAEPPSGPRRPPRPPSSDPSIWTDDVADATPRRARAPRPEPSHSPAPAPDRASPEPAVHAEPRRISWGAIGWGLAILVVGALLGAATATALRGDDDEPVRSADGPTTSAPTTEPAETTAAPTTAATTAVPTTAPPAGAPDAMALATALAPMQLPSDCGLPLGVAESLPNAARDYRGGVHEGIDFICSELGRDAVASLDGQVVIANDSFVDPEPGERVAILDVAKSIGHTPPWTLAMLFGRFVVIDHGVVPGVGHVVTIYAHLNDIDPAIRPGARVTTGQRVGEVGNAGTESAGTGEDRPQAIHLHWEIHIDERFLGEGASSEQTSQIYATLFGR